MADKSKDTGTGGINVDGKVYTPDVGVSDAKGGAQGNYSSGDINVDKTTKDISKPTRETFAKYLSKTTLGTAGSSTRKNVYPVAAGDQTKLEETTLKDSQGNPVSPGPQNNEAKFNAGFNQQISSNNPAGLRRGAATGTGPDGNKLLATAAVAAAPGGSYIKPAVALNAPIAAYTNTTVEPNLFDFTTLKVIIGDGALISAGNIRPYQKTTNLATDAGTSVNVFDPAKFTSVETAAELIKTKTTGNAYPVDSPVSANELNVVTLNSAAVLANSSNTNIFGSINIGSSTVISKGKLVASGKPDGNKLLANIAPLNATGKAILTTAAASYTTAVLKPNLHNYDTSPIGLSAGSIGESPTNPREDLKYIPADSSISVDGGKSINILGPDATATPDYTLTLIDRASYAETITKTNFFKVDAPSIVAGVLIPKKIVLSTPLSVTDAQNNPFASFFFTKEKQTINGVDKVVSKLESSYTDALAASRAASLGDTDKFIIKRGKTENANGIDGNALLSTIAPKIDDKVTLTPGAQTYITAVLKPNLNDIYDPKTESGVVIPEYENDGAPSGIKDLNKTHTFATDAGTSKNILGDRGARRLKLLETATQASKVTVGNFFKVDLPNTEKVGQTDILITKKLTGITPDSVTDAQNNPFASSFFTKGIQIINNYRVIVSKLESSYSNTFFDASKNLLAQFSIKRGKVAGVGETGNELLPLATIPAILSDRHIKFTALNANVSNYTTVLLKKNLYSINNKIEIGNLQNSDFFGLPRLHKPESGLNDAGTFDNIQKDPSKRAITQASLFQYVIDEVAGKNAPGNIGNVYKLNVFSSPNPKELFSFTTLEGTPISPTILQNASENLLQYTHLGSDVTLQSSYSNATENLKIRRGKSISDPEVPDGNTLLKDAAAAADAGSYIKKSGDVSPTISKYVGAVLGENRYSPQDRQQFVPSDTPGAEGKTIDGADPSPGGQRFENISDKGAPEISFVGRTTLYAPSQLKFGESPQSMVNRGEPPTGYTFRRLTRIGTILQLRAAGEIISITGDQNDDPRSNVEQLAAMLVPGAGQAGAGVPLSRELLNVTEIIKNLPVESTSSGISTTTQYEGELIDFNSSFEGVINTALEKFSGFTSFGLSILAIVLVAVIVLVFKGLTLALGNSASLDRREVMPANLAKKTSAGIHGLGSFKGAAMGGGTNFIADLINAFTSIPPSAATALFGISPTYNREYSEAVTRGALAFFGVGSSPPPLLSFPGQVIVTSRAIIRGVAQLVKAFIDMGSAFASGNITAAIFNLIGIIEVIRNSKVIKALNTFSQIGDSGPFTILGDSYKKIAPPRVSKNILGITADSALAIGNMELYDVTNDQFDIGIKISEIDSVDDTNYKHKMIAPLAAPGAPPDTLLKGEKFINKNYIGLSQVKSRLRDSTALAWSTYRAPSLFVTMKDLGFSPDDDSTPKFNINTPNAATYADPGPRISSTKVKAFEDALDGEYMPFYFQDLRTNEIIGLHAFLTSLSDDYSANYESVSGIGRAEPVRIYKDTQRKIGLSFMLAALDKNDFDHMWDKVNRLTMLVYPQYTAGKLYNGGSGIKFEKPFTQQVGASPMVRLRLGNLLRSNYSKFNLARIFGIGSANTKVDLTAAEATAKVKTEKDTADAKQIALVESTKERIRKTYDSVAAFNYVTDYTYKFSKVQVYFTQLDEKTKKSLGTIDETAFAAFAGKTVRQLTGPTNKAAASARFVTGGTWFRTLDGDKDTELRFKLKGKFGTPDGIVKYAQGIMVSSAVYADDDVEVPEPNVLFYVPVADLVLDDESANRRKTEIEKKVFEHAEVKAVVEAVPAPTPAAPVTSIAEFMSADKNVIVKSFESTGGKGLAGFIDSINFDWYDRTTWDIEIDRKAPKMCKVTISFTPIHDISPGLDVHGNNRAPIYPLGPYAYGTRKGT